MERGVVVSYDADRGFGFIRSKAFPLDVFVHASAPGGRGLRPGQRVRFEVESTDRGPRAVLVEPGRRGLTPAAAAGVALGIALIAGSGFLIYRGWPWWWAWLGAINGVTPIVYAFDKRRAGLERRRVPEVVLLGLAFIGGSPGAALAMGLLRHKTRKLSFLAVFAAIVVVQVAALGYWIARR